MGVGDGEGGGVVVESWEEVLGGGEGKEGDGVMVGGRGGGEVEAAGRRR